MAKRLPASVAWMALAVVVLVLAAVPARLLTSYAQAPTQSVSAEPGAGPAISDHDFALGDLRYAYLDKRTRLYLPVMLRNRD